LPALGWGEKDGTVTNSERVISRQRGFLAAPGAAQPDWWIMAQVAKRMGWGDAFAYTHQAEIFAEYAAMTRFEDAGGRVLSLPHTGDRNAYDTLQPFQWGGVSPFAHGVFPTPNGKANLIAVSPQQRATSADFPLRLNTARYRDQWHTMTRTGLSPKLSQHRREPVLEIHPDDAGGLTNAGLARVETPSGAAIYRVLITDAQRRGDICVPMHWSDQMSTAGRTGVLPGKDRDPLSGQPGFKNTPARVSPVIPDWAGFLVTRQEPADAAMLYRTKVKTAAGWLVELAGLGDTAPALAMLPEGHRAEVQDARRGTVRAAVIADARLSAALFIAKDAALLPPRDWLIAQLAETDGTPVELLAGRPATPAPDRGPIVCVCFDVGMNSILDAIATQALTSVEAVGAALHAGTNCGSCRPAIARLLAPQQEVVNG
jgi:assimilatory nitrate reductase catalytic subunit